MLKSGRLIAPFNESIATAESFFLATPSNKPIQSHAQKFKDWLIQQAEKSRD
jgi:LysR family glycine cleavage system transcriptional activator